MAVGCGIVSMLAAAATLLVGAAYVGLRPPRTSPAQLTAIPV